MQVMGATIVTDAEGEDGYIFSEEGFKVSACY